MREGNWREDPAVRRRYDKSRYHEVMGWLRGLLGGQCVVCGARSDLHIDHIDPSTKDFTISARWTAPAEVLLAELAKCQLLCSEHHREKSAREASIEHGATKWGKKGCSCDTCKRVRRAAHAERKRHLLQATQREAA